MFAVLYVNLPRSVTQNCTGYASVGLYNVLSHPKLYFRTLDWNDALDERRRTNVSAFFKELGADLILGADLVCIQRCFVIWERI